MTLSPANFATDPGLRVLSMPLSAIEAPLLEPADTAYDLPEGAVAIPAAGVILAGTPVEKPQFEKNATLAAHLHRP